MARRWLALGVCAAVACGTDDPLPRPDAGVVFGSLVVTWRLVDAAMNPLECEAASLTEATIAIGGAPETVPCEQGQLRFDDLLPQRYPVFLELKLAGTVIESTRTNAIVEAGKTAQVDLVVPISRGPASRGGIDLSWRVAGQPAATECDRVGATWVRIEDGPSAREPFSAEVRCNLGQARIGDLVPGGYDVRLILLDDAGGRLSTNTIPGVIVKGGEIARADLVNFLVPGVQSGAVLARYTFTGTTTEAGCAMNAADRVVLRLARTPAVSTSTPCAAGAIRLEQLRADRSVDLQLLVLAAPDPVTGISPVITSSIAHGVPIPASRTATISIVFDP